MIISLAGFMGSGKTTVGRELSILLGWTFIDLDEVVAGREGMTPARILAERGEPAFRESELAALEEVLGSGIGHMVLSLGGGTLTMPVAADIVFSCTRCVWLKADLKTIRDRIGPDMSSRPLFDENLLVLREPQYVRAELHLDTADRSPVDLAREIICFFQI